MVESCRTTRREGQIKPREICRSKQHSDKAEVEDGDRQSSSYTSSDPDPANGLDLSHEISLPTASDIGTKSFYNFPFMYFLCFHELIFFFFSILRTNILVVSIKKTKQKNKNVVISL